jgi:putative DNA primase/helicase
MQSCNRDVALRLAEAGISIFPAGVDKKPLLAWRQLSSSDPEAIEQWWRHWPNAVPGIDLEKSDLVALDGDRHGGPDGHTALLELLEQSGFDVRSAPTVTTPSGGIHIYFGQNGHELTNARGELPAGIDIRGAGGYTIAPDAELPGGRGYRRVSGTPDLLAAYQAGTIPHVPESIVDLVRARGKHSTAGQQQQQQQRAHAGIRERAYADATLDRCAGELAAAAPGGRNELANKVAYRLGRMVARGWIDRAEVEAALLGALEANGYIGDDGLRAAQITLRSGLDAGERNPHPDLADQEETVAGGGGGGGGDNNNSSGPSSGPDDETPDTSAAPAFSEEFLALDFAARYADELRHVALWGKWLHWNGRQWLFDKTHRTFSLARLVCRDAAARINRRGAAKAIANAKTRAAVISLASDDRRLAASHDQWDLDPMLLNTSGGIVDLRTGILRPATPADYMTKMTAVAPGGACPQWRNFLETVTGDNPGLEKYLQVACGYSLTGLTTEEVLLFLHGQGQNGKSVFIRTIAGALGSYHATAPIDAFLDSKVDRHPTEIAGLRGARMVTAAETEQGRRWSESRIKTLTGGDKIAARFMRQDFFEFAPQFKLWIFGNHKPALRSVDKAISRRMRLVPFTVTIPDDERDNALGDKLKAEWSGILAWMIEGCLIWQREGLVVPKVVSDATDEYLASEDAIGRWLEECCIRDPSAWTGTADLYGSWKTWAENNGEFLGSVKRFVRMLEARGFQQIRRRDGRGFAGLKRV